MASHLQTLGVLLLATVVSGQVEQDPLLGGIAPADTWYTEGGCAARTGVSLTQAVARHPEPLWTYYAGGELVGEPLVWGPLVFVERSVGAARSLHILRLRNGRPYTKPVRIQSSLSLRPSVWERRFTLRTSADQVRVFEVGSGKVQTLWKLGRRGSKILAPLLLGDELFVLSEKELHLYSISAKKKIWSREAPSMFGGLPSVCGDRVFVIEPPRDLVHEIDRKTGEPVSSMVVAGSSSACDMDGGEARVVVNSRHVLLYRRDLATASLGAGNAYQKSNLDVCFRAKGKHIQSIQSVAVSCLPCLTPTHYYSLNTNNGRKREGEWIKNEFGKRRTLLRGSVLAGSSRNSSLLRHTTPVSVAGDVAYLANLAFHTTTQVILWRGRGTARTRVVPARNALLIRYGSNRLVALGRPSLVDTSYDPAEKPEASSGLRAAIKVKKAWAIMPDGSAHVAAVTAAKGAKVIDLRKRKGETRQVPVTDLRILYDKQLGFVAWHGNPRDTAAAFSRLLDSLIDTSYLGLLNKVLATNSAELIESFEREAMRRGGDDRIERAVEKRRALIAARSLRPVPAKIRQVLEAEAGLQVAAISKVRKGLDKWLERLPAEHQMALLHLLLQHAPDSFAKLWPRIQALTADRSDAEKAAAIAAVAGAAADHAAELWPEFEKHASAATTAAKANMARAVLEWNHAHSAATELVRSLITIPLAKDAAFRALDWLDLIQTFERLKVTQVKQPPPEQMVLPYEQRHLVQYQWRKDLVAFQSKRLLVITPVANPAGIARCLSLGELVCDSLLEIFAKGKEKRHEALRLRLIVCDSKKEYLKYFAKPGSDHLEWSAGHYNGQESRMFLRPGAAAFERVMPVFTHELTHHWVEEQCPMFNGADRMRATRMSVGIKGYWIVEGFANMVEQFDFDLRKRSYRTTHPKMPELDMVASASQGQLLPWKQVLRLSHAAMNRLSSKPDRSLMIATHWDLGLSQVPSQVNLFYAQSTAVCHYLFHAEEGKYRQKLLQYLGDHYAGRNEKLDVNESFGMSERQIGKRAVAHAKALVRG